MSGLREVTARERVLKHIRKGLIHRVSASSLRGPSEQGTGNAQQEDTAVVFARKVVESGGQFAYCGDTGELRDTLIELTQQHPDWPLVCYDESLCRLLDGLGIGFAQPAHSLGKPHFRLLTTEFFIAEEGAVLVAPSGPNPLADPDGMATLVVVGFTHQLAAKLGQAMQLWVETHGARLPPLGVLLKLASPNPIPEPDPLRPSLTSPSAPGHPVRSRELFACLIEL
jgi:hypothetical protein